MEETKKLEPKFKITINDDSKVSITKGNMKIGTEIYSVSLLPGEEPITTKASGRLTDIPGTCAGCCDGCEQFCYAMNSARMYPSCIQAWGKNTLIMRRDLNTYFSQVDKYITDHPKMKEFRWQVAGEIETYEYLEKMNETAEKHPDVKFGFYTKRFEFVTRFQEEHGKFADNLVCNISEWNHNTDGFEFLDANIFCWDDCTTEDYKDVFHCPAVSKPEKPGGKGRETGITCDKCGRCYRKHGGRTAVYNH